MTVQFPNALLNEKHEVSLGLKVKGLNPHYHLLIRLSLHCHSQQQNRHLEWYKCIISLIILLLRFCI